MQPSSILNKQIALICEGHGGKAAYNSLFSYFKKIELLTNDKDIEDIKRPDDKYVEAIEEIESNLIMLT